MVVYDGAEKADPNNPKHATGAQLSRLANNTVSDSKYAINAQSATIGASMALENGINTRSMNYVVVLDHGDSNWYGGMRQQLGDNLLSKNDIKFLGAFVQPGGAVCLYGCSAGDSTGYLQGMANAAGVRVYAFPFDVQLRPGSPLPSPAADWPYKDPAPPKGPDRKNTMKQIAMIAWLVVFLPLMELHAEVKVLDGMPYVEKNGVRLYVDAGKKNSIEIADTPQPKSPGEWWTVRAYIQNAGEESVQILLGHETNVTVGFPDSTSVNVSYRILSEATVDDIAVKPPVGDLRLVVLEPGEVAQLPIANVQLKERGKVKKMKVTYAVDGDFTKWFKVWSGGIELVLDKDRPPSK